jgi:hypothetical protein
MSAKHDQVLLKRQFIGRGLVQQQAIGSEEDHFIVIPLFFQFFNAPGNGLYGHDHAGTPPKGIIVNTAVLVAGIFPEVMQKDFNDPLINTPFYDGMIERPVKHSGEDGNDVNSHDFLQVEISRKDREIKKGLCKKQTGKAQSLTKSYNLIKKLG